MFSFSDSDLQQKMADLEERLTVLHGTADGVMTVLEKGSLGQRLERCESQIDRLDKVIKALCDHVGFSVRPSDAGKPAVPFLAPSVNQPSPLEDPVPPPTSITEPIPTPTPILNLIGPTPVQSQESNGPTAVLDAVSMPGPFEVTGHPAPPPVQASLSAALTAPKPVEPPALPPLPPTHIDMPPVQTAAPTSATHMSPPQSPAVTSATSLAPALSTAPPSTDKDLPAVAVAITKPPVHLAAPTSPKLDVPRKPRSRKATPVPDTLQAPQRVTRSRSRSASPLPEASGSKRKAEGEEDDSARKKSRI